MPNQAEPDRSSRDTPSERILALQVSAGAPSSDLASACRRAVEAGFDGVEWAATLLNRNVDPRARRPADRFPPPTSTGSVAAIRAVCGTADVDRATLEVASLLRGGRKYGARCLNVALPASPDDPAGARADGYQASLNLAFELLHELRFEAEQAGVALALESGTGGTLCSPVELRELVDAANSWAVGACVDIDTVARLGSPEDWLATLGRRVHALRVTLHTPAASAGSAGDGPGGRSVDHAAIVRAIERIGFAGVLIVAGHGAAASILTEARRWGYVTDR